MKVFPQRNSLFGKVRCGFKDLQVSYPWYGEWELDIKLKKPEKNVKKIGNKNKFHYFQWIKTFVGHKDPENISATGNISALGCFNDFFLTGSSDKLIKIWNLNTGVLEYTFHGHQSKVLSITVEDNTVYSVCNRKLIIWHLYTGNIIYEYLTDSQSLGLIFISSSTFLLSMKTGKISLFDMEEGDFEPKICEIDQISAVCITYDCQYLITSSPNRLKFWAICDFNLVCEYILKAPVSCIKCSKFEFLATSGKEFNIWKFTNDCMLKYWEQNGIPFANYVFSVSGSGCMDWCGCNFLYCLEEKSGTEVCCKAYDFLQTVKYPGKILTMAVNEMEYIFVTGDSIGNVILWNVPDLEQLFKFQETGNLSLLHGTEISITHCMWSGNTLVTGSNKGTHTLYGFGGNQDLVSTPIQQFYSMDYLSEFTKNLTMCDFKLNPYKFQPKIPKIYSIKGYKNSPGTQLQLYNYFKHQENLASNPFFFEEDVLYLNSHSENNEESVQSPGSVRSVLELNSDINCFRCKKAMLEDNKWCNECGRTFHAQCFDLFKGQLSDELCLLCFKSSKSSKELKISQRLTIRPFVPHKNSVQVGDSVVFIFQAYEVYLKNNPEVPLLDSEILQYTFPTIMQIQYIEYLWPAQGTFSLVSDTICQKLQLSIIGSLKKTYIYLIESPIRFLIPLPEYLHKLKVLEDQPTQLQTFSEFCLIYQNILEISPVEAEFDHSPYKSLVLDNNQRASFWDTGDFELESITQIRRTNLSRFTHNPNLLTKPTMKNFKVTIAYPVSLKMIEEKISENFYRTKNAAIHDVVILRENIKEFFGQFSQEFAEFNKIFEWLKKEICDSVAEPKDLNDCRISSEFSLYLPENYQKVQIVHEKLQNKFRKLRKLD